MRIYTSSANKDNGLRNCICITLMKAITWIKEKGKGGEREENRPRWINRNIIKRNEAKINKTKTI